MKNENKKIFQISEERNFGFKILENRIQFLIPKQLMPTNDNDISYLIKYTQILNKYNRSIHLDNNEIKGEELDYNDINLDVLNSYLVLLDDYMKNDYFKLFEKFYKSNNKKINWNKTLKENDIIISKNNIIYNNFFSKDNNINSYHQFYLLYIEAIRRVKLLFLGEINQENYYPTNKNEQQYHIYKYIDEHFKDREILIAHNLANIFINDNWFNSFEKNFEFKYYLKFEHIWQKMIEDNVQKYKEHKKIPKGELYIIENKVKQTGLDLRPDHFIKINENYYLLDSKFYNSIENEKYPNTEDIAKQFLYKHLLEKSYEEKIKINNFFIFPKNTKNKNPELIAVHSLEPFKEFRIFCVAVDIEIVISCYLSGSLDLEMINYLQKIKDQEDIFQKPLNKKFKTKNFTKNKDKVKIEYIIENNKCTILKNSEGFFNDNIQIKEKQKKLLADGIIKNLRKNVFIFNENYTESEKTFNFNLLNGALPPPSYLKMK